MFSPTQVIDVLDTNQRSSRRRQRPLSSELSTSEPKRKRQRGAINHQATTTSNDTINSEGKNVKAAASKYLRDNPPEEKEMVVRTKKSRSGERLYKGDGSIVLSSNDMYTVTKLPSLPDRLRSEPENRASQHGAIYSELGYALTLTHTHAIIWLYAANISSPEVFVFALNHHHNNKTDPLPIGSLVSSSASSPNPGLVVIIPTTGKITYWESISCAATLDFRLQRNGVEHTITGLASGETVVQLLNAESAGLVITFSTGRIAYMSVRDGQGRPAISVQFLKTANGIAGGGLFGSIRNALSSTSLRGDISSVKAGPAEKIGERDVVVATVKGRIQQWKMHRGGHTSLVAEVEGREIIFAAMKNSGILKGEVSMESSELIDLTFIPKATKDSTPNQKEEDGTNLLILSSLVGSHHTNYFLIHTILKRNTLEIRNLQPIKSYTTSINRNATSKARLYLPKPALVAFVIFDRAVVVLSIAKLPDSADSQLRAESHLLPKTFDDVIDFRDDVQIEIVGSGMEEPHNTPHGVEEFKPVRYKSKYPTALLLVRGGGILRVAATDVARLNTSHPQQVSAKTKLEQAVFYGSLDQNPLSFSVRPELRFLAEEVGAAAVELSDKILRSETAHISSVAASVEYNLQKRSAALRDLAHYLRNSGIELDRVTKWKLLTNAEKMKAATLVWKRYDSVMKSRCPGEKRGLLTEVVESIHENYRSEPVAEAGELDRVRHWFVNDIWNMEIAVPWAYQIIRNTWREGQKGNTFILQILSEANDLVLGALQGAYEFRSANLNLYGLSDEELEDGVLTKGYEELPEFWTSTTFITENTRKHCQLAAVLLHKNLDKPNDKPLNFALLDKIRSEYGTLVDIAIRSNTERIRWCSAQESPAMKNQAEEIKRVQSEAQNEHISVLASSLELPDEAMDIAEKHQLFPVLATILKLDLDSCTHFMKPKFGSNNLDELKSRKNYLRSRIQHLFVKFGTKWATALCEVHLLKGSMGELLDSMPEHQAYLTGFLRSKPKYAKISWINDVTREKDFDRASQSLLDLGLKREKDLWSKKTALSIGKLALLASRDKEGTPNRNDLLTSANNQLSLIKIQSEIYDHILPVISAGIDENAELELALESYGNKALENQTTFRKFLEERMSKIIKHEAMSSLELVDLLTLMDTGPFHDYGSPLKFNQFYLALKVISIELPRNEYLLMQRIIWRRCILRDDWSEINNTTMKDDAEVSAQSRATILYQTIKACFQNRLFEKDSNIKPMSPSEVLGAGTEELDHRFKGLDSSIKERIMKDMKVEDDALRSLIDTVRLEQWHKTVLESVKLDSAL
ncbi:Nucleoporin [Podosphaera aphanis]|nr:Nucleoporin [Podosphaera aphanis]